MATTTAAPAAPARPRATPGLRLYEAAEQLATVERWIDEHADDILANGGALPPALEALLDEADLAFDEKAARVALVVRDFLAQAAAAKGEAARLKQREAVTTNAADALKAYLKRQIEAADRPVKHALAAVRVQRNGAPSLTLDPALAATHFLADGTAEPARLARLQAFGVLRLEPEVRIPARWVVDADAVRDLWAGVWRNAYEAAPAVFAHRAALAGVALHFTDADRRRYADDEANAAMPRGAVAGEDGQGEDGARVAVGTLGAHVRIA